MINRVVTTSTSSKPFQSVAVKAEQDVISVDDCMLNKDWWPKSWLPDLHLTEADRTRLTSPNAWLSDSIINAAQALLKTANPSMCGLQNVNLGQSNSYDVQRGEFVQIIHNGKDHWQVISTVGIKHPSVNVFDSLYCFCSDHSKVQIASLLLTNEHVIKLKYIDVQKQFGKADCGLFAVAFAVTLVNGLPPGSFFFEQCLMRKHLLQCLESGQLTMFPIRKERRMKKKIKRVEELAIYCTCRMPLMGEVIHCNMCKEWFHTETCVKVEQKYINTKVKWLCDLCSGK